METTFNTLDFTTTLIQGLIENEVYGINQNRLEKDLYLYKKTSKYISLFTDIDCDGKKIDLNEALATLKDIGVIYTNAQHQDYKCIDEVILKNYMNTANIPKKDQEKIKLVKCLAKEYALREKVEKKSPINLKIYGLNPNSYYNLMRGECEKGVIEWNLITDGLPCNETSKKVTSNFMFIPNPENNGVTALATKHGNIVKYKIENATFTIMQGKIGDIIKSAILYTECVDKTLLEQMADYALLEEQSSEVKHLSIKKMGKV